MNVIMEAVIYPDKPLIVKEDWEKIVKYYAYNAPEKLEESPAHPSTNLGLFSVSSQNIIAK